MTTGVIEVRQTQNDQVTNATRIADESKDIDASSDDDAQDLMELLYDCQRDGASPFNANQSRIVFELVLAIASKSAGVDGSQHDMQQEVLKLHRSADGISELRESLSSYLVKCFRLLEPVNQDDNDGSTRDSTTHLTYAIASGKIQELLEQDLSELSAAKRSIVSVARWLAELDKMLSYLDHVGEDNRTNTEIDWPAFLATSISYAMAIGWSAAEARYAMEISEGQEQLRGKSTGGKNTAKRRTATKAMDQLFIGVLEARYGFGKSWKSCFEEVTASGFKKGLPNPKTIKRDFRKVSVQICNELELAPRTSDQWLSIAAAGIADRYRNLTELEVSDAWVESLFADWRACRLPEQVADLRSLYGLAKPNQVLQREFQKIQDEVWTAGGALLEIALSAAARS